jgi:transcriptional regulator with GAF, ATPase, and Fis domain
MISFKSKIEAYEKDAIQKALEECDYVMVKAAKQLGITERMIGYKIKKYGIEIRKGGY